MTDNTIEEAYKHLQPALLHDKEHTNCGACGLVKELLLAVLDAAEKNYAQNYDGANEGDDVAAGFRILRQEIQELGK